jgi:hypothetical protein
MRKIVPFFNGYEANDEGYVISLEKDLYCGHPGSQPQKRKERILKGRPNKKGYLSVVLYKGGKQFTFRINRLIWIVFKGEIPEGMEVNHINAIKTDNRLVNLELTTRQQNMDHAVKLDLLPHKKLYQNEIQEIKDMYLIHKINQRAIAVKFNVCQQTISKIIVNS